jgi:Asp-tRNA(Asn)/Glu-tRNA(Gln) amidotransferase A subunit family amidase
LKPTPGRVSAAGHFPVIGHPGGLLGAAGPMARTANDVRLLFAALAGYDSQDPFSAPVPLRAPQAANMRIGLMEQFYDVPVEASTRDTVRKTAGALRQIGFQVEPFKPRGIERAPNLWWFFFGQLSAPLTKQLFEGREQDAHWTGTEFLATALEQPAPTANDLLSNLAARDRMRAALLREMETVPLILSPVCGVPAFRHRERRWNMDGKPIGLFEAMMPVTPWNLLGMPAMTVPFGMSAQGLPIGVQLIGRPYEEELILEVAVRLEEARGTFPAPPGLD